MAVDVTDPQFRRCPFERYAELRETAPAFEAAGIGVGVLGYDELVELGRDSHRFSRQLDPTEGRRYVGVGTAPVGPDVETLLAQAHPHVPALFTADPPVHTRHRKLVAKAFLPRRVLGMEPLVRELATGLLDGFADDDAFDLVEQFAVPLPLNVIGATLGVAPEDRPRLKLWSDDLIRGIADVLDDEQRMVVARSLLEFQAYFRERLDERQEAPRDDLLSDLLHAELEDGSRLSLAELFPIIAQLVAAGHETTTNFIVNSMMILLEDPALYDRLRADPGLLPGFLEESLRYDPPLHSTVRRSLCEAHVWGVDIHEHETVLPFWGAGNRDPEQFPDPDRFDPARANAKKHLSFGHGIHFCIGAELARLEARVAYELLLARYPRLVLDREASDLERGGFAHYGYRRLVLRTV